MARAFDAFTTAAEKVDLAAVLAVAADITAFHYTTEAGMSMELAGWERAHVEYFPIVTAHRFFPRGQRITVLAPDAVLVSWTGAMEIVPKEGAALRVDPFSASFVFRLLDGAWRIVAQHESGPPARPVASADPSADEVATGR